MNLIDKIAKDKSGLFSSGKGIVTFLNPYSYLVARKNTTLYESFDSIFADGALLSAMLTLLSGRTQRISFDFTSIAQDVFEYARSHDLDVFVVGSTQENVSKSVGVFRERFPGLIISGSRDGYFDSLSRQVFIKEMVQVQPKIIIVGMGAPLQEVLLKDLKLAGWEGLGFTCGGFLHQTAKFEGDYYPSVMDKLNLRWLYRMYDEPKLIKRYVISYPIFLVYFCVDALSSKLKRLFFKS
ncbi:WecB/TagA/CpsF family glycosyltransferase [Pseudomonas tussilaginis]|uniref:WecB/TagA/CpsF family glycosyltransferase n=1 Tax=Pseudomonas sp. 5 TaxID=1619949 RepID=UPI0005EB483B|nr:WecB/TagA/CpsF family glycosyltransferase [Pseudomonas sp. 5]KJK09786.1 hypothetical protein UB47_00805 [Pseudomonas sp. 5]